MQRSIHIQWFESQCYATEKDLSQETTSYIAKTSSNFKIDTNKENILSSIQDLKAQVHILTQQNNQNDEF